MSPPFLICFYGPESTGKSTLAVRMAERYRTGYVPEVAREIITSNKFTVNDIIRIARAQDQRVREGMKVANRVLFCDSDLITTGIYSRTYLGVVPREVEELEKNLRYDQYFLFDIDVPWVPDGLRDLGEKREEMFAKFKSELERRRIPYILLSGNFEVREQKVTAFVDALLSGK